MLRCASNMPARASHPQAPNAPTPKHARARKPATPLQIVLAALALIAGLLLYWAWLARSPTETESCASPRKGATEVLFIGNSHTFVNDLPGMFCALASPRHSVHVESVAMPDVSLRQHWDAGTARKAIERQHWDWIVLQESSRETPGRLEDSIRLFDPVIAKSGAKALIYELWPRRDTKMDPGELERRYILVAHDVHHPLARVGPAWMAALADDPNLPLYRPDGNHAQPAGTYLAACVFYATIFGQSPVGLPGNVPQASELQRIAWAVATQK
jgi:hypothetical protein